MSKKIILILFSAILFLGAKFASAEVVINEFVSHPNSGEKEWVELFSTDLQDLTGWSLTDLASPGAETQHENPMKDLTGLTIPAGEVLVVEVSGLNDGGDSIGLYDGTTFIDRVTYGTESTVKNYSISLTAPSIGKSGALISNTWKTNQDPTKGGLNPESPSVDSTSTTTTTTSSGESGSASTTTTPPEPKPKVIENPTMKAKIIANTLAFTGEPLEMQTKILGYSNENVILGRAFWNFGDGSSFVQVNNFEKFSHTYYYPGEYAVFLEYYLNSFSKTPEATSKMTIKVLPTTVTISKVGDAKDFFIELTNNASSDIDISNWVINASGKIFILPKNSVIMSKKQMTISGKITGFVYGDQSNLKLFSGSGELVFDYNSSPISEFVPKILTTKTIKTNETNKNSVQVENKVPTPVNSNLQNAQEIPASDLTASAILSDTNNNDKNSNKSYFFFWGFIVLLVVSGGAVYYIRQGKNVSKMGDDFKIIDE